MYSLIRVLSNSRLLKHQLPSIAAAFLIAEFFYKFHSFALECLAFLATWMVFDLVVSLFWPFSDRERQPATET